MIEKTTLGASRKEHDPADVVDSPTIEVQCSWTGAAQLAGEEDCTITIDLPTGLTDAEFTGHIVSDLPQPAEVGGLLTRVITIKPVSAVS